MGPETESKVLDKNHFISVSLALSSRQPSENIGVVCCLWGRADWAWEHTADEGARRQGTTAPTPCTRYPSAELWSQARLSSLQLWASLQARAPCALNCGQPPSPQQDKVQLHILLILCKAQQGLNEDTVHFTLGLMRQRGRIASTHYKRTGTRRS